MTEGDRGSGPLPAAEPLERPAIAAEIVSVALIGASAAGARLRIPDAFRYGLAATARQPASADQVPGD